MQHPEARDTVAGIRQWWLQAEGSGTEEELTDAMGLLVRSGFVRAWEGRPGEWIYGLSQGFVELIQPIFRDH